MSWSRPPQEPSPPHSTTISRTATPRVFILHAPGTNRDRAARRACALAGARAEVVLLGRVLSGAVDLLDADMLVLPGGFSFGDDLGAGTALACTLRHTLGRSLAVFVDSGRPVLGICNGFQALVRLGLLPGSSGPAALTGDVAGDFQAVRAITLSHNAAGRFECRWVRLAANPASPCVFTRGLGSAHIACPVAHAEGRVIARDAAALTNLEAGGHIALRYASPDGGTLPWGQPCYPANPNGSQHHIAGVCNRRGNVLGLMPHPEDHITSLQSPTDDAMTQLGLPLFAAGVRYAAELARARRAGSAAGDPGNSQG